MGICNCDDTYNKATRLADEISKQHAAFAEDPDTLDEWKAVNYMASPRTEARRKVFHEHHQHHVISPRTGSPKVSARSNSGGHRVLASTGEDSGGEGELRGGVTEVVVEEVRGGVGATAAVGEVGSFDDGGWSDDEDNERFRETTSKKIGTSTKFSGSERMERDNDVASFTNDSDAEGTNRELTSSLGSNKGEGEGRRGVSFKHEHKLVDIEEDMTESTSQTNNKPRLSGFGRSIPALHDIFLGDSPLIMRRSQQNNEQSTMTTMDAKKVYGVLRKESCRDTQHLLTLLRWRLGDAKKLHGAESEVNEKLMSILVEMGIPVFLAMEVTEYMKQFLYRGDN